MANNTYKTRVQMKNDTAENWSKAQNFIPLAGEIIVYSDLNKIKIGDGTTLVGELEFIAAEADLSNYITYEELEETDSGVFSDYITASELEAKGYLTEHQDLNDYVKSSDLQTYIAEANVNASNTYEIVGLQSFIEGDLTNDNIANAIAKAVEKCSRVYIPKGDWSFNAEISDVNIELVLDDDCSITTSTVGTPIFTFTNCNVLFYGGKVHYTDESNPTAFPNSKESEALVEFINCDKVIVQKVTIPRCDYACAFQFENCGDVLVDNCHFENLMFSGLHLLNHARKYIVRNCYCKDVKIPTNSGIYYSYFSYTGVRNIGKNVTNKAIVPPDYVLYENNYCEDCRDSAIDSHGASVMRAIGNTIINCNTSITLYDDSRRVSRPDGFYTRLIEVVGNRVVSDYYNELGQHPAFIFGSTGNTEDRFVFKHNYVKNTVNAVEPTLNLHRIKYATIEDSHIEGGADYTVACRDNNLVHISNCEINSGSSGRKIILRDAFLRLENLAFSTTDLDYAVTKHHVGVMGAGVYPNRWYPMIYGGQIIKYDDYVYMDYTGGWSMHPEYVDRFDPVEVTVTDGFLTGAVLPEGTRCTLKNDSKTYSTRSKTVSNRTSETEMTTVDGCELVDEIEDGTYTLTINSAALVDLTNISLQSEVKVVENAMASTDYGTGGIILDASGTAIEIVDGSDRVIKAMTIYGMAIQDGTPTPETPIEVGTVGKDGSFSVNFVSDSDTQTATITSQLPLCAVPVSSGGNVTIDGQQYIADTIEVDADGNGKIVKRTRLFNINEITSSDFGLTDGNFFISRPKTTDMMAKSTVVSNAFVMGSSYDNLANGEMFISGSTNKTLFMQVSAYTTSSPAYTYLKSIGAYFIYALETAVEYELSADELAALTALHTVKPLVSISNSDGGYQTVTYYADTKNYIDNKIAQLAN